MRTYTTRLPRVLRHCGNCGEAMLVLQCEIRKGNGKYCSPACHRAVWWGHRIEDFWEKVEKQEGDGCWLWTGSTSKGYGSFSIHNKGVLAHRLSWELLRGTIPDGLFVCHNCPGGDNPRCVRPDHLFLGTQVENMADAAHKGRTARGDRSPARLHPERIPRGERSPSAKLTSAAVLDIRARGAAKSITFRQLAAIYGVSVSTCRRAASGESWRHMG